MKKKYKIRRTWISKEDGKIYCEYQGEWKENDKKKNK